MGCKCRWPDDFCERCERRFTCGSLGEACPVEGCSENVMQGRYATHEHPEDYPPERFHDPIADSAAPEGPAIGGFASEGCTHDSTRADGWLDDHCLWCGHAGYWRDGRRVVAAQVHPSGKLLLQTLVEPERFRDPMGAVGPA